MADDLSAIFGTPTAPAPSVNRPTLASEADLAVFWDVSTRQVRALLSEGVIIKAETKLYDVQKATSAYLAHLAERASRRTAGTAELTAEKLRLTTEQADSVALKNAAARGELVSAESVKSTWAGILRDVRAGMLAIPGRVQARLSHLTAHDARVLDNEIRDVLSITANDQKGEG